MLRKTHIISKSDKYEINQIYPYNLLNDILAIGLR